MKIFRILFVFIFTAALVSCAGTQKQKNADLFVADEDAEDLFEDVEGTEVTEVKYGNKLYLKILSTGFIDSDSMLTKYVNELRNRLITGVERETFPYIISILKDRRIYASSTPGGYIYVSLGMMNYVTTESELAAVLAHEIALTQYKPMEFRLSKKLYEFASSSAGMAASLVIPGSGRFISSGRRIFDSQVLQDPEVEEALLRADKLAIGYLDAGGFRPEALLEVFMHVSQYEPGLKEFLAPYAATRPLTDGRLLQVKELLQNYQEDPAYRSQETVSYQNVRKYLSSHMSNVT